MASSTASLAAPLLGVLDPGQELEQPHARRDSPPRADRSEVERVGYGQRPVEVEEDGRHSEGPCLHGYLLTSACA